MKTLLTAAAAVALIAAAGTASAQMYQPMPAPTYQMNQSFRTDGGPVQPMQQPTTISGAPSWARDDGSSSDYPIHNRGDQSGDPMNTMYQGGINVPPGAGFPAYPGQDGR